MLPDGVTVLCSCCHARPPQVHRVDLVDTDDGPKWRELLVEATAVVVSEMVITSPISPEEPFPGALDLRAVSAEGPLTFI